MNRFILPLGIFALLAIVLAIGIKHGLPISINGIRGDAQVMERLMKGAQLRARLIKLL